MSKKYIRQDFYDTLELKLTEQGIEHRVKDIKPIMESMFELIADSLCLGYPVRLHKIGRLNPYWKAGGRPVRNPKTMETMSMPSRFAILLTRQPQVKKFHPTLNLSDQEALLTERLESLRLQHARKIAKLAVETFQSIITKAREEKVKVEIRGLGVFITRTYLRKNVRNPQQNKALGEDRNVLKTLFKPSHLLDKRLQQELAEFRPTEG